MSSPPIPPYAQCQGCRGLLFQARVGSCGCLRCLKCYSCADHPEATWRDQPQIAEMVKAQFASQVEALELDHEFKLSGPDRGMLARVAKEVKQQGNDPSRLRDVLAAALGRQVVVCHAPLDLVFYPPGSHAVSRLKSHDDDGINHLHVLVMPGEETDDDDETEVTEGSKRPARGWRRERTAFGYLRKDQVPKCPDPHNPVAVLKFISEYPPQQYNRDLGIKDHPQVAKWLALPFHDNRRRSPDPTKSMVLSGLLRKNCVHLQANSFDLDRAYELFLAIQATCREPFSSALWPSMLELLKELKQHCSGVCTIPEVLKWMPETLQ